jgi:OOP family OmpA-OmpF porin
MPRRVLLGVAVCCAALLASVPDLRAAEPVAPESCSGRYRLRGLNFASDSAQVEIRESVILLEIAERLTSCPNLSVRIEGHTDATGSEAYNQKLSEARAEAVKQYLVRAGISDDRLISTGFGHSRPLSHERTPEARELNRRVSLTFVSADGSEAGPAHP